jgi:hypothetical protein
MELKNVEIIEIGQIKTFANDFKVIEFVVKTNDEYPQLLQLQCTKDKAENLLKFNKVGDFVDVSLNLRGRAWTNPQGEVKYFNTIEAWKVFKSEITKGADVIDAVFEPAGDLNEVDDDLPF